MKEKEICNNVGTEIINEINTLNNKIKHDKLMYDFKSGNRTPISCNAFNRPLALIRNIKDVSIDLEKGKENKEKFKSNLNETITGKWEHKSEEHKNTINNLKMFYKAREKVITLFEDYITIVSKAKYEAKHGKGHTSDLGTQLKVLTSKQMLQRFPIALAQVKAGNISENLLNQIRQAIYSLYQAKENY